MWWKYTRWPMLCSTMAGIQAVCLSNFTSSTTEISMTLGNILTSTDFSPLRLSVLLLYLAQKERWVVRPLSNPCDGFLSLKATNLAKKTIVENHHVFDGSRIHFFVSKPDSNGIYNPSSYTVHHYFVVHRFDYLCEVKDWGAVESMHNQAVEMAAEIRAQWPMGACNTYHNLALQSEMLGNTQKTIDFLAQEIASAEDLLAKKDTKLVPANLYCKLGESALDWSLTVISLYIRIA